MVAYDASVFVNVPFDDRYQPIFRAIAFTVFDCGFIPRCALEEDDGSQVRVDKLYRLVAECRLGIHDISRTELCGRQRLPRFNMPFELGLFLGAKKYGDERQRQKSCLILDRAPYRYQAFCSDISGQDVRSHAGQIDRAIGCVRNWLSGVEGASRVPGGAEMARRHRTFVEALPSLLRRVSLRSSEMTFRDYSILVSAWLLENPRGA